MKHALVIAGLVLVCGLGMATFVIYDQAPEPVAVETGFDTDASAEQRILALEQALAEEREARQMLETQLFDLINEVDGLIARDTSAGDAESIDIDAETTRLQENYFAEVNSMAQLGRGNRNNAQGRAAFLVAMGFAEDRAAYIAGRESELRFEVMQAQWEARQDGEAVDWRSSAMNAELALREELGTAEYEQYLEAIDRPTAIAVNGVMQSSPAEGAGLRMGDRITHYNGERVYNMRDINRLVGDYRGNSAIVIEIERDGVPMQVSLPPGPLGITGNNWRRRR